MLHGDVAVARGVLGAVDALLDFGDFVELAWVEDEAEAEAVRVWFDVVVMLMLRSYPIRVYGLRLARHGWRRRRPLPKRPNRGRRSDTTRRCRPHILHPRNLYRSRSRARRSVLSRLLPRMLSQLLSPNHRRCPTQKRLNNPHNRRHSPLQLIHLTLERRRVPKRRLQLLIRILRLELRNLALILFIP